jgi:dATP pyrophosphohydrolase
VKQGFKRPESVLVLIYTGGDVLLMERRQPEGYWQSVTGALEWGEAPLDAAHREIAEETGLRPGKALIDCGYTNCFEILPAWRSRYAPDAKTNTEHVFRVEYSVRPPIRINLDEHSRYRWLPWEEALELASSRTNREAIRRYLAANC